MKKISTITAIALNLANAAKRHGLKKFFGSSLVNHDEAIFIDDKHWYRYDFIGGRVHGWFGSEFKSWRFTHEFTKAIVKTACREGIQIMTNDGVDTLTA